MTPEEFRKHLRSLGWLRDAEGDGEVLYASRAIVCECEQGIKRAPDWREGDACHRCGGKESAK